ncbi:hypothetical protein ACXR0O_09930 [Verrucomicrobiota bacterium sgz303538]
MKDEENKRSNAIVVSLLAVVAIYVVFPNVIGFAVMKSFPHGTPEKVRTALTITFYPLDWLCRNCPPYGWYCQKQFDIMAGWFGSPVL